MKSYKTNSMIIASIQTPVRLPTLATFYFSTCVNLVELSVPLTETNGPVRYKLRAKGHRMKTIPCSTLGL